MAQTIGEYLYRIAWSLDKSGAATLKKEGNEAQKSVDGLGKSLDKTEQEAKDLTAAADKTSREIRDVGDASREATTETSKLNDTANAVTSSLKRMVAGLASIAAVKRTFSAIISAATEMDALANSAAAVGASAAGMARLAYATDLAGVNASEMDSALKGVRQSAAQAAAGIGAGVKAWKMIGISTRDENGNLKDTTRLIDELGAKFAQMDEGRAQALGKLLHMTPAVIGALRTGMMDYAREFDQALGSMTPTFDEAVKAAQRLHSAQSRLQRIMALLWQGIASRFFEPFAKAFDSLRQTIIINQDALIRFGAAVIQPLALLLSGFAETVGVVSNALTVLTNVFDALGLVSQTVIQTLLWGAAAYALALHKVTLAQIAAAATNPFVLIGAAIVAVMLLLDDFATAMRGGKTYFNWDPAIKIFKSLREWGAKIEEWIISLPDKITGALTDIWKTLKGWWTTAINWMSAKWDAFVKTITGWMPDTLKKQLGIKVEGNVEAPEIDRAAAVEQRRQVLLQTTYAGDPAGYEKATHDAEQVVDREIAARQAAAPQKAESSQTAAPAAESVIRIIDRTSPRDDAQSSPMLEMPDVSVAVETPKIKMPELPQLPEQPPQPAPIISVDSAAQAPAPSNITNVLPTPKLPELKLPDMPEPAAPIVQVDGSAPVVKMPEMPVISTGTAAPAPEIRIPEIKVPEIKIPEIKAPEIKAAEVTVKTEPQAKPAPMPIMPTPQQFAAALAGVSTGKSDTPRAALAAAAPAAQAVKAMDTVAAGGRTLNSAQPLGSTTITNNNDNSRKYDIPVIVTNSTTVNVTTTNTDAGSIADQVGSAVDTSNAKLVRDMQSPLSAIADEPQTSTTE